jgi:hypothetical protein
MGPAARGAAAALVKALGDKDERVQHAAAEALRQVDPGAVRRAGVKD